MSASYLTLLDLAKRTGSDAALGLLEEITTVAPELSVIPVRPRSGTTYKYTSRTGRPSGGFRSVNSGATPQKSTYKQQLGEMFFFDGLMNVDEAIVKGDDRNLGDVLADEGSGILQDTILKIGTQLYSGTSADAKGFTGFRAVVDPTMVVDATGTGTVEDVWFAYLDDRQGIHFPIGNAGAIDINTWQRQQISDPNDSTKSFFAWVNNLSFYMGLHIPAKYCLGCIKNVTAAKPWTDNLTADMIAKFPIGKAPNRIFASRVGVSLLQKSRTAVGYQLAGPGGSAAAPLPTMSQEVPITRSDSVPTEAAW